MGPFSEPCKKTSQEFQNCSRMKSCKVFLSVHNNDERLRLWAASSKKCTLFDEHASSLQKSLPFNWGKEHKVADGDTQCNIQKVRNGNFESKWQSIIIYAAFSEVYLLKGALAKVYLLKGADIKTIRNSVSCCSSWTSTNQNAEVNF